MSRGGKRFDALLEKVDRSRRYTVAEAVALVRSLQSANFVESVELALNMGIDPRQADQNVRGSVALPKGIGRQRRVIAFCDGDDVAACLEAGAIKAGGEDLAQEIQDGWMDFDVALAAPRVMRFVGKLGRILGPQGKMPSPKSGTVTDAIAEAVGEFVAGRVEYRNDNTGNLHVVVGKADFTDEDLAANVSAFLDHIRGMRPASVKGAYIQKAFLSTTMGPSVSLAV